MISPTARYFANTNYQAQQSFLKTIHPSDRPALNAPQSNFDNWFLMALKYECAAIEETLIDPPPQSFYKQHIAAMVFTDGDEHEIIDGVSPIATACLNLDAAAFLAKCEARGITISTIEELTGQTPDDVGRDLWYTRNGHGCGFWDGGYASIEIPDLGDQLTEIANSLGVVNSYTEKCTMFLHNH